MIPIFRYLLFLCGILVVLPAGLLTIHAFVTPITITGVIYLLGCWLIAAGLLIAPWQRKYPVLMVGGVITIALVAGVRLSLIRNRTARVKVIVLPSAKETRWINSLIDERDSVLFGEAILHHLGGVSALEHDGIVPALFTAYKNAESTNGVTASPFLSTYVGIQKPTSFDAIVVEPAIQSRSPVGIVFLHGFMGNVTIQCLQIAQATESLGAITVCPSTTWVGDWWKSDGEAIIHATFSYLRDRGIERIYVGGYSNGGYGLGSLVSNLAKEPGLKGLFFIAGARNGTSLRSVNLPVLVIQGSDDERMPAASAHRFVNEVGKSAAYVELKADHFLIIKHSQQVQGAIRQWLHGQELDENRNQL